MSPVIPPGLCLAKWLAAKSGQEERQALALDVQKSADEWPAMAKDSADAALYRQVASLRGPLLAAWRLNAQAVKENAPEHKSNEPKIGPDPAIFGIIRTGARWSGR